MPKFQFLIGAAGSGSGKTTFTIGLLRALRNRGLEVQPFKCGPDYLDTKHHAIAAGRESFNLDAFMSSVRHIREVYRRYGRSAEICITEGVMGLFDGYQQMEGSSARIAGILDVPVVLVVNAASTAYSVAALLYGFKHFCPEIRLAGAVFNFVGSESHYAYLKEACRDAGVEALGYLPKCPDIEIPSRHLGLSIDTEFCLDGFAGRVAALVEKTVDIERLLEVTETTDEQQTVAATGTGENEKARTAEEMPLRISVARDEAFNFIYPENLRILGQKGVLTFFSPLRDTELPPSDFVYLPGGYPEFYLPELSANSSMRESVRRYCLNGGRLYAECGGMMYLCEYIRDEKGKPYPMCGYLPQEATMEKMKLHLGYRKVIVEGKEYRGHEFHYSAVNGNAGIPTIGKVLNARGMEVNTPVYRLQNVTAGYIHLYWGEQGTDLFL